MDSDKDFEPGESEDEAVPWNIEIARNLQKTQTDMVKQVGKTRREGNYQIGDWVSLDKEPRSSLSKMDAVRYGPFKVVVVVRNSQRITTYCTYKHKHKHRFIDFVQSTPIPI